ncbi:MAG TPA: phosphatase PAP2 family protein [Aestuariivirgaceae bacterium]|nr:phosphatase PAP2 family protein [Aestuariivirgaceae bacterium]
MRTSIKCFIAATGAALVAVTVLVQLEASAGLDNRLRDLALASELGTFGFWLKVSFLGSTAFLTTATVVLVVALVASGRRRPGLQLFVLMIGALILNNGLKWILRRERPPEFYPDTMPASFSYPSGHALMAFVFYFAASVAVSRMVTQRGMRIAIWTVAGAVVGAIGVSRVFLGVHYPSDVIAGYLVGAVWLSLIFGITSTADGRPS